jgi:hypothetical protein
MNPATTVVAFSWDLPTSLPVKDEVGAAFTDGWTGAETLQVEGSDAQPLVWWRRPEGWDASRLPISMGYGKFRQGDKRIDLAETVPYQGITDPTLVYPLTLDPSTDITVSVGANDGDGYSVNGTPTAMSTAPNTATIGYLYISSNDWDYRGFWRFDLSSLSGKTCDSCDFKSYTDDGPVSAVANTHSLYLHDTDWSTLDTGDFGASSTVQPGTNTTAYVDSNQPGWFTWACTAADIEAKFGGWAAFEMRGSVTTGGTRDNIFLDTTENATGNDPTLSITYSSAAGFKGFILG